MAINLGGNDDDLVSTINTTPLVDVMLVMLIIFLITIPVVTHTVPVTLPVQKNQPLQTKPQNVNISVNKAGDIFWDQQFVPDQATLLKKLEAIAVLTPQPAVQIRGDQQVPYKYIGEVLFECQQASILKVGFITEPQKPD
jgi:biopolymer transport protein ExbD